MWNFSFVLLLQELSSNLIKGVKIEKKMDESDVMKRSVEWLKNKKEIKYRVSEQKNKYFCSDYIVNNEIERTI